MGSYEEMEALHGADRAKELVREGKAPNHKVTAVETERVRVTMIWEVDADVETSVGGGVTVKGIFADPKAIFAQCDPKQPLKVLIEPIKL